MEFIDALPAIQAPMMILHHNVTTVNIALDGDYAEGEVYMLAFHQVQTEDQPVDLFIGGRYFDRYEKRAGVWKFSHRAVVADWATFNNPTTVCLDHPMIEGSHIGRPGPEDPSYAFFRLFNAASARAPRSCPAPRREHAPGICFAGRYAPVPPCRAPSACHPGTFRCASSMNCCRCRPL